jgi:hypothetical protein
MGARPKRQWKATAEPLIHFNQHDLIFRADERLCSSTRRRQGDAELHDVQDPLNQHV